MTPSVGSEAVNHSTKNKSPLVDFFRSDAINSVLERFDFTDDERKTIQAAIRSAKKARPNMMLIDKADALLKKYAANKTFKKQNVNPTQTAKAIAQAEMERFKNKNKSVLFERRESNISLRWSYGLLTTAIVYAVLKYVISHYGKYTLEEAQEICQKRG